MAAHPPNLNDWYSRQGMQVKGGGLTIAGGGNIRGGKVNYGSGTGFWIGYDNGLYKFDIGSVSSYLRWTGTALSLIGDISGTSSIHITGQARFEGSYTGTQGAAAVYANESGGSVNGVIGLTSNSSGVGVGGYASGSGTGVSGSSGINSSGIGVAGRTNGASSTGTGVLGTTSSSSGTGVWANGGGGGVALKVTGGMTIDNSTLVTNLNADKLDGQDAAAFLPVGGTATNSTAVGGIGLAQLVVVTSATVGSPGAATHTLNCTLNGTAFRIPVLLP